MNVLHAVDECFAVMLKYVTLSSAADGVFQLESHFGAIINDHE